MKKQFTIGLVGVAALIVVGCGSGGTTTQNVDKNDTNTTTPPVIVEWELSKDNVPVYQLSTEGQITDFQNTVYPKHPRLYFRDTDFAHLQAKMSTSTWSDFKEVVMQASRLPRGKATADAIAFMDLAEDSDAEYARLMAFMAFMERDSYYLDLTFAWARHLSAKEPEEIDEDIPLRRRIERLSEIYDWFHADLSESDKALIRAGLKRHIDKLMTFNYMSTTTNYIQKHSRWAHGVVAQALLAMYGDFDETFTKAYADNLLSETREHLRKYQEAESYIAEDGGWHLGWGYAYFNANYTFNYLIWSTATNETMLDDWMGGLSYWYLYALRADYTLPQMGDATESSMGYGIHANLYQSTLLGDGYAKWYIDTNLGRTYNDLFMRFIFLDDSVVAKSPDTLPTSRHFENAGTVIARDSWDFENTTLFIFKSSPFYNAGHHHRDENSFTIDYKTSLALDTGFYDATDSEHYKNYYTRTIAHNAITVYNPNQVMEYITDYNTNWTTAQKRLINDGGQIYRDPDSTEKAHIEEGGFNRLDGILRYQHGDGYTYARGDASKAYDPQTVTLAKREVVYVQDSGYDKPVVLVLDKVEATSGDYQKRYLLHSQPDSAPLVVGNRMEVTSTSNKGSAQMVNVTLFPSNATLSTVGGSGGEYRLMDGSNPEPLSAAIVNEIITGNDTQYGTWRLEVSPPLGNQYDMMLNAVFVDDAGETINTANTQLIESDSALGAQLPNRVVVFSKEKSETAVAIEYTLAQTSAAGTKHTVMTNYSAGESVRLVVNGATAATLTVGSGGCVDFEFTQNLSTSDQISITK